MISSIIAVAALLASVPAPWSSPVAKEGVVSVWGREYAYASNALPISVKASGTELLAGAMRVVCCDADGKEIVWTKAGSFVQEVDEESVTMCGWQESQVAAVDAVSRIEFDGMIKVSLALVSGPASNTGALTRVYLEIPMRKEAATLFHYSPSYWGNVANVGAVKDKMTWPFRPSV